MLTLGIAPLATVHACATCHGLFVGARAWSALVAQPELASELAKKLPVLATPPARLVQLLQCPTCAHQMDRGRFGASSSIVIDVCLAHGVWLDGGEVVAIAALAAKRAAEGAPSIPAEDPNVEAERSERALVKERSAKREKLAKQIGVSVLIAAAVFKFLLLVLSKD
jgi:Zn-finger nucleic acid-binding protein